MKILKNNLFSFFSVSVSLISVLVVLYIVFFLTTESIIFLKEVELSNIFSFQNGWNPLSGDFSFLPMIIASLLAAILTTFLILFFVLVISVAVKFYCKKNLSNIVQSFFIVCNAIPSVVYGFWGITFIVPLVTKIHFLGTNLFSGVIILTIMLLPTSILLNLRNLDSMLVGMELNLESLGLSLNSRVKKIYIPLMLRKLPKVLLLAYTRAIGETIAIVMVAGNVVQVPSSVFDSVRVLTSNIALEMAYATDLHRASLFFSGILISLIIGFTFIVFKTGELFYKNLYR